MMTTFPNFEAQETQLTIVRIFDAPRALVFRMWTEGEHLRKWSCPKGMTIPFSEGDIRAGGSFRTCMRETDGTNHWLSGTYREIVDGQKIVFSHAWQDAEGNPGHQTLVTVIFADAGLDRTRVTLHQAFFADAATRDGHRFGWEATMDSLSDYLAT